MGGEKKQRIIFIAGSIMSGLGKGILTSAIGKLLQARGFSVSPIKFDGYLNVDCGTMNPFRHGEVFVLDDGSEVDMDFGTYERFLNQSLSSQNSITGGKLFQKLINKERKGGFLGRDVQFIPHMTNQIKEWIENVRKNTNVDVLLVEVGGTVGDIETGYFLEAVRQMLNENDNNCFVQLTFVPSLSPGEQKTKPTQQANRLIQSLGIKPDIIVCREEEPLSKSAREKIALYCDVDPKAIFDDPLVDTVYDLPLVLEKQDFYEVLAKKLNLPEKQADLRRWKTLVGRIKNPTQGTVRIGIVGKYTAVKDAYVSIKEALLHSAAHLGVSIIIDWVESTEIEDGKIKLDELNKFDGMIVPGGFGKRGIEGKISAIKFVRENKIPYLGICLGMQLMVIEYARNVCNLSDANSKEFNSHTKDPLVCLLPEQQRIVEKGATMRLGAYDANLEKATIAKTSYKEDPISERHRHRYEVNPEYVEKLKESGLVISGTHPKNKVVEIVEWEKEQNGFGIGTQAHIELKSRLEAPAPIFISFVKAAMKEKE